MSPRLQVLLPRSGESYPPKQSIPVNSPTPTRIHSPHFDGVIAVWVRDYHGDDRVGDGHEYFAQRGRQAYTYAIVVRGRFLQPVSADDVVFGNVFEKPIRDSLPWGTAIATKFMHFVDPNLEQDIYSDKPWALSPLLASVNYLSLRNSSLPVPSDPPIVPESSNDALRRLVTASKREVRPPAGWDEDGDEPTGASSRGSAARRKWLSNKANREAVVLDQDWEVGIEFANGLLDFNTLSVSLPPPFTLHIPLLKYWDGQPVAYVCRSRDASTVFWSVAFQIVDADAEADGAEVADGEEEEEEEEEDEEEEEEDGGEEVTMDDDVD